MKHVNTRTTSVKYQPLLGSVKVIYQRLDSHNGWLIRSSLQLLADLFLAYVRSTVNISFFKHAMIAMHPRFKRCDFKHDFDQIHVDQP